MGKPNNTGIMRALRAAKYSAQGFAHAWRYESAFRQELGLTAVLVPVGLWLGTTTFERVALISMCFLVLVAELLNSAVEAAIDRHGDELHELSGRAKDLGSAAVFVALMMVVLVWGAVVYERFFA